MGSIGAFSSSAGSGSVAVTGNRGSMGDGSSAAIAATTRMVALLGKPTGHSLSPAIHNLSFRLLGINAVYLCFDVDNDGLGCAMAALRALERWDGCNVTMPGKRAVIPFLDELDPAADLVGAVNVVSKDGERLVGHNTDGAGFVIGLAREGVDVNGARITLLGPGGAGSAIVAQAALDGAAHLDVFARGGGRSFRHATALAERVEARTGCEILVHDIGDAACLRDCIARSDMLANATPVGMGEGCDDTPVPSDYLRPGLVVADAIYHPRETRLVRDARERGCAAVPGLGMLVGQAAASERIWYGAVMPVQQIERSLL